MGAIDDRLAKRLNAPRVRGFDGLAELLQQQDDARRAQRVRTKKRRNQPKGISSSKSSSHLVACSCRAAMLLRPGWGEFCPRCGELLRFSIG